MRTIKVSFILTSDKVSMDYLAEQIGIYPYVSCSTFPENSIAKPYWYVEVVAENNCLDEPLYSLSRIIWPHQEQILEMCSNYGIKPSVLIVVDSDYKDRPELTISLEILKILVHFKAELSLEIVNNWD